jgi:signal transduction histidine kinase/predicted ATPase/serine/threonine protein kinase/DNA-binding NarL/FixJ family response regulator
MPNQPVVEEPIVARLSYHVLREERTFHIAKSIYLNADPNGEHIVKPIELVRIGSVPGDKGPLIVAIYQFPGRNYLNKLMDPGPAFFWMKPDGEKVRADQDPDFRLDPPISLPYFLDFAIGATQCLELVHHSQGIVHGEIRSDAFHYNIETNKVKLLTFGSGLRSFEHGLTSTGWSTLSKELGAKNKLLFISPEQTGRMPAEPDTRTDIYSLGVVLWMLLTQKPVFDGETPLDIVQGVLGRRIPNVSLIRFDVPDVIGRIIQKCTAKNVSERYHSASGLRFDLMKVQELMSSGDMVALNKWQIGSKDVSSFFLLPVIMIGRNKEKAELLRVIDRVAKNHAFHQRAAVNRFSDGSSLSNEMLLETADLSSEGASSNEGTNRQSGSFSQNFFPDPKTRTLGFMSHASDTMTTSADTAMTSLSGPLAGARPARPWERHQSISFDTRSTIDSLSAGDRDGSRHSAVIDSTSSALSRQLGSARLRRRGHCEIVTIEGAGGLGKSCLVQSVQAEMRKRGYCATAKFDTARRVAFGPLLKLLSSLFRQVWGERDTDTPFHQALKRYVRPAWPMLHKVLGLPEFLLGAVEDAGARAGPNQPSSAASRSSRAAIRRRGSETDLFTSPTRVSGLPASISQDFFNSAGSIIKSSHFVDTYLDVLRMFSHHKFICFCIDDLHFADDESLDLLTQIIGARMRMLIILTFRPDEMAPERVLSILQPPVSEEFPRAAIPTVTRVTLSALDEDEITQYVAMTLSRSREDAHSLALVIQSKTAGNPFYMREMLSACYRKKCIWYDYRDSQWHYDLDKLFDQFQGQENYETLDTDFVTRRLGELCGSARAILAWASLIGHAFSFELICKLLSGEFQDLPEQCDGPDGEQWHRNYTQAEAVEGLQAAIQACIIVPSEQDDRFRFAHDRYLQAASALKECKARTMHFAIARTLLKYYCYDTKSRDNTAAHICASADLIKRSVPSRRVYRKVLFDCAQAATEAGARPTAAKYYSCAIGLLQDTPWSDGTDDVFYQETLQLHLRLAECYLYMSQHASASRQLQIIFASARNALDKAPAWVLQSRIYAQKGDSNSTLNALTMCLEALGIHVNKAPTWETCDAEFERLSILVQTQDRGKILDPPRPEAPVPPILGGVFAEAVSAAWWTDCTAFYHMTLLMLNYHLVCGAFPQSGTAFTNTAVIALSRFNMVQFAIDLSAIALELLQSCNDPYSLAKGYMLYANFVSHIQVPLCIAVSQVDAAIEYAAAAGDRISTILGFGLAGQLKFFASEHVADLELFCQYSCEEIPNWHFDTRGGTLLIATRQLCRALQGKTHHDNPLEVMTDDQHNAVRYKSWLTGGTHNGTLRSLLFYETLEMVPLFLYGHYERAVELGKICYDTSHRTWSIRNSRLAMLFYGLSLAGLVLRRQQDPRPQEGDPTTELQATIAQLETLNKKIKDWQVVNDVNYLCWSKLLDAQVSEMSGRHGLAIQQYEEALDHASEQNFVFEEALGNYLMANIFTRHSARRSARSALKDAVSLYRQMGAVGIAARIEEEHSLLLHGPSQHARSQDAGVQTDFTGDSIRGQYGASAEPEQGGEDATHVDAAVAAMAKQRTLDNQQIGAWRGSTVQPEPAAGLPALDMIDLHAILVSSQVISSVLRVEELLKTMCDVVLQTCGGSATQAAIIVQNDDSSTDWCVAASGEPERGAQAHVPGIALRETPLVAENVVLYCTRFREVVLIPDLVNDERFGNVSEIWLQKNPLSKAVIALPISHGSKSLLGVLYLEGVSGSFTDRNVSVLQLLVNQIGISYSNALAMKAVEKVSAENVSMVALQKRALAKAIEAEAKAKDAEAEANRNVKLAEEAAKAKSIFLANVSHELRTPLNGVIGNSELLRESSLNKEQLEMADSIRVSADLLLTVINDILDFSKMEADKMKLYVIAFNPEEMVREVVRAVSYSNREKASKKNVRIIQNINLPPVLIYGDPIRLHQVLGNLINNSVKFTEDGSITIGARLDSETAETATLTFWVEDTGIGIPPKQLQKLFQPFSQADASTQRKYGGSGLGLSICKSLIETMMKGKIRLESQENVGTTAVFTVTFDKARPEVAAGDTPTSSFLARRESVSQSVGAPQNRDASPNPYADISRVPKDQLRICIAEDNVINQKIALQYLQRLGYPKVDAFDNGQKAVDGLRQKAREGKPYHVILMDVQMPVLDGYEATKVIRQDTSDSVRKILVIAMTASAIQGDREKCLAAGMNDYLAKPVRSEVLRKKLETYTSPQAAQLQQQQRVGDRASDPGPPRASSVPRGTVSASPTPGVTAATALLSREQSMNGTSLPMISRESSGTSNHSRTNANQTSSTENLAVLHPAPSRTSSDTTSLDGSLPAAMEQGPPVAANLAQGNAKRQPKKLTKNRGNTEVSSPQSAAQGQVQDSSRDNKTADGGKERQRLGLLQKRSTMRSSNGSVPTLDSPRNTAAGEPVRPNLEDSMNLSGTSAGSLGKSGSE